MTDFKPVLGVIISSCLFAVVAGCGKGKPDNHSDTFQMQSGSTFDEYVQNARIENSESRAEAVGLLLRYGNSSIGVCTSSLISHNMVLTNSHCIPENLKKSPNDCPDSLAFVFKAGGDNYRRVYCKKILFASEIDDSNQNPDVALVELQSSVDGITPFHISRTGINEGEIYNAYVLNSSMGDNLTIYSTLEKKICQSKKFSVIGNFVNEFSSIVPLFKDDGFDETCRIIRGNSGSPLTDSRGEIRAVIFATLDKEKALDSGSRLSSIGELGLATNMACQKLNHINFDDDIPYNCREREESDSKYPSILRERLSQSLEKEITREMAEYIKKLPAVFKYEFRHETEVGNSSKYVYIEADPKCVIPTELWVSGDLAVISSGGLLGQDKKVSFQIPKLKLLVDFESVDMYGRHNPLVKNISDGQKQIMVNLSRIKQVISDAGEIYDWDAPFYKTVFKTRWCTNQD